jgi:hypothetical protein
MNLSKIISACAGALVTLLFRLRPIPRAGAGRIALTPRILLRSRG